MTGETMVNYAMTLAAADGSGASFPVWGWIILALVAVALIAVLARGRGTRSDDTTTATMAANTAATNANNVVDGGGGAN